MKKLIFGLTSIFLLAFVACNAQIKNAKTETVKIYGNCEMCEKTIENAGNLKNVATVDWDKNTKMATITYNAKKTTKEEILKRIALAGYDSDEYKAPEEAYANLKKCCQYREEKMMSKDKKMCENCKHGMSQENGHEHKLNEANHEQGKSNHEHENSSNHVLNSNQLIKVYEHYFSLKDALVNSDAALASSNANEMLQQIKSVDMAKLSTDEHTAWMKVLGNLTSKSQLIASAKTIEMQRTHFMGLSDSIYTLLKSFRVEYPIYRQHCPMANGGKGANWLSKEEAIKNPYYGNKMLSCGETKETL